MLKTPKDFSDHKLRTAYARELAACHANPYGKANRYHYARWTALKEEVESRSSLDALGLPDVNKFLNQ